MRSITDVMRQFELNWTDQLETQAIAATCRDTQMSWLESMRNPVVAI